MEVKKTSLNRKGAFIKLEGKNILVTGGAGFIGSHLVEALVLCQSNVIVLDIDVKPKSYFKSQKLAKKVKFIKCNVRDYKQICNIFKKNNIDYIFHLAAEAIVEDTLKNPRGAFETNIMGTVNICEAARLYGKANGIVVISSDKAYGKIPRAKESDPLCGDHPYETSKSSADLIAQTYFKTFKMPIVVTRFGNVYGEGDLNFSRIIPGIMESVTRNKTLKIRSNGKYVRDYVYVGDIIDSLLTIIKNINNISGETFNVSSYENLSVLQLIKKTEKVLGKSIKYRITNTVVNEIPIQSIDFGKISKRLGWVPSNKLGGTLGSILDWYKINFFK